MNTAKITLASTALAAAFGLALGLSAVPSVSYACDLGVKHHGGGACGGGGGGDPGEIATNNTLVKWAGGGLSEPNERSCHFSFANRNGKNGSYGCEITGDDVTFNLGVGDEVDRKGRMLVMGSEDCDDFSNGLTMVPNPTYEYDWNGFCDVDGCDVRVQNWFFDDPNAPDGTGLIRLEAFGHVSEASNPNPFADEQHIDIDEVLITVKGEGTDKTVLICRYDDHNTVFDSILPD